MSLSIIIPHFNQPYLLEKLLKSIPQDKKDIQTIVVDDKSEIIHINTVKQLKRKFNFELYLNHKIKSAGICRNIGLEKANGQWILFADGDDHFVNGFYDKVSKYFNIERDVIFFTPTSQQIDTEKFADRHLSIEKIIKDYLNVKSRKSELLLRYNLMAPWSKMINKKFIDVNNIKFDQEFGAEDVMFSTKIGYFMKHFEVSRDVIYCIILRYGSNSRIFNESLFDIRLKARVSRIKFLNQNLSKQEIDLLNSFFVNKAAEFLIVSLNQFGIKKFLQVYTLYKKNKIKWFHVNYLNPIKLVKYIAIRFVKYIKNYKYNKS